MYKLGSSYTHTNTGGAEVDCPMCLGKGEIKTLESFQREIQEAPKEGSVPRKDIKEAVTAVKQRKARAAHDQEKECRG